jgi:inositol oxygenase
VHDLGKLLLLFGAEGQWDVVGVGFFLFLLCAVADLTRRSYQDTFVVGCKFSDKIIYHDTFTGNPDSQDAVYSTEYGIYQPHCGLDNVMLSWGHDEVSVSASASCILSGF